MLFEPAGDGAHEVLTTDFALPVVGFTGGGAVGSDVVGGFLEDDFGHCFMCVKCGKRTKLNTEYDSRVFWRESNRYGVSA